MLPEEVTSTYLSWSRVSLGRSVTDALAWHTEERVFCQGTQDLHLKAQLKGKKLV